MNAETLCSLIVGFAKALAATPVDRPSARDPRRSRRQVLLDAIEGATDVMGTLA